MKSIKDNWKMYGITIYGIILIPCYYDIIRFYNKLKIFYIKNLRIFNFSIILIRYCALFDTSINFKKTNIWQIQDVN